MRGTVLIAMLTLIISACNNAADVKQDKALEKITETAKIQFEHESYNFGVVHYGDKVKHEFKFKNTGAVPLIITNAQASCGCTVPQIPKEPINPGKEGIIGVVFNTIGKSGMQNPVITISSNADPSIHRLHLTGEIIAAVQ